MSYHLLDTTPAFAFSPANLEEIKVILTKYPANRQESAVLPLLEMAQRQNEGWVSKSLVETVAHRLEMPFMRVYELVTFYSMFNLKPTGKYLIQFCRTTPCWLKGSDEVQSACKAHLNIDIEQTTEDGLFTLKEVECLGACVNAPVIQINDDYYENLNAHSMVDLLENLRKNHA